MRLFDPDRHSPLSGALWSESRARRALQDILDDVHAAYGGVEALWPIHPLDRSDERPEVLTPLYYGAGGVIWALHHLDALGRPAVGRDYRPAVATLVARGREDALRLHGETRAAYMVGDTGVLMLQHALAPSDASADELEAVIGGSFGHPAPGFSWGGAGTALAALFLFRRTGEARWRDLYRRGAAALWAAWAHDPAVGCWVWTQDLYGHVDRQLGALHGFAGVAHALIEGRDLLAPDRGAELVRRVGETLAATALREGAFANWPMTAGPTDRPGGQDLRVQHCMGAPGMVNALAGLPPDPRTDALLTAAGELTWLAGPPAKAPGLCHGAPGSGYAFLKLHARTGEAVWLERARAFAMHAVDQARDAVAIHGQRKFSLWTGDLGLACFLWDCIEGRSAFPTLDQF